MNILSDPNIPLIEAFFSELGDIGYFRQETFAADLKSADILIVRSNTVLNPQMLKHSNLQVVATATSGTDHLPLDWLAENNIPVVSAKGCNATAVADFVLISALALWPGEVMPTDLRLGLVGYGYAGRAVAQCFRSLGFGVSFFDPLLDFGCLSEPEQFEQASFEEVLSSDIVSIHTPLTHSGQYATYKMLSHEQFRLMRDDVLFINASRGDVVDLESLKYLLAHKPKARVVLDVWPDEPNVNLEVLNQVSIATPHIAGYSLLGKYRATELVYQGCCKLLGVEATKGVGSLLSRNIGASRQRVGLELSVMELLGDLMPVRLKSENAMVLLLKLLLPLFNPFQETNSFRSCLEQCSDGLDVVNQFNACRHAYRLRPEIGCSVWQQGALNQADQSLSWSELLGHLSLKS